MNTWELKIIIIRKNIVANVDRELKQIFGNNVGVFVPNPTTNLQIYNNVFDTMGIGVQLNDRASDIDIKNNVFEYDDSDLRQGANVTFYHNLKYHSNYDKLD